MSKRKRKPEFVGEPYCPHCKGSVILMESGIKCAGKCGSLQMAEILCQHPDKAKPEPQPISKEHCRDKFKHLIQKSPLDSLGSDGDLHCTSREIKPRKALKPLDGQLPLPLGEGRPT